MKDEDDLYGPEMESPVRPQPSHTRLRNLLSLWRLIPFSLIRWPPALGDPRKYCPEASLPPVPTLSG